MATHQGNITLYTPDKTAAELGSQFEPSTETHHFGFVVKIVDPGCTLEVQIEERSGRVTRLTTTENSSADILTLRLALYELLTRLLTEFGV